MASQEIQQLQDKLARLKQEAENLKAEVAQIEANVEQLRRDHPLNNADNLGHKLFQTYNEAQNVILKCKEKKELLKSIKADIDAAFKPALEFLGGIEALVEQANREHEGKEGWIEIPWVKETEDRAE